MLFNALVILLFTGVAIAAPYPAENGISAVEAIENSPDLDGLKMPVGS